MSMQAVGQLQPILVEPDPAGGYAVYDGHRRLAAVKLAKLPKVKAVIQPPTAGVDRALRQVAMHTMAQSFDPIAEAEAIHAMFWQHNMPEPQIARVLGHSPAWVRDRLALMNLTDRERDRVRDGSLTLRDALAVVAQRRSERDVLPLQLRPPAAGGGRAYFGPSHRLAGRARALCEGQRHRFGVLAGTACGACWEQAIREDERKGT
jgi:ParB/RepB/Spo0J family partition protein